MRNSCAVKSKNSEVFRRNETAREKVSTIFARQTQNNKTMEEGGGTGRNKSDLPKFLTKRRTV